MKLTFLGTRGYIEARTRRHYRHASLLVSYRGGRLLVDWGQDWLGRWRRVPRPHGVLVTHAHPDHAFGLENGAPCPVWATGPSWDVMTDFAIEDRREIGVHHPITIAGITCEAFTVEHSTRAPAVGYRLEAGRARIFYVPDLVYIHERAEALRGVDLYIGDGATIDRDFVRRRGQALIGHAPVRTQLTWCGKEDVPRAIFSHCGSQIVSGDERRIGARLRRMAAERGDVVVEIAHDGMEVVLR